MESDLILRGPRFTTCIRAGYDFCHIIGSLLTSHNFYLVLAVDPQGQTGTIL